MRTEIWINSTGEFVVTIPDELLDQMGWAIGDSLKIEETLLGDYPGEVYGLLLEKIQDEQS